MVKSFGACLALLALAFFLGAPATALARTPEAPYVSCTPAYQTVSVGDTARFFAVSNVDGPFAWVVGEEYSVRDLGSEFYAQMQEPGEQQVAVVWGGRRSYCTVYVVGGYGYQAGYYGYTNSPLNVTLSAVAYPSWPNAGFGPQTFAGLAFAFVLLLGASIAFYPHAKKAFAIVAR
jgi:hypothetical protein